MAREDNLIPFNKMSKEKARAIQSKGGKQWSDQRQLAAVLKGLKQRKDLDPEQIKIMTFIKEHKLETAILGVIMQRYSDFKEMTYTEQGAVVKELIALVPNKNLNINQHEGVIEFRWMMDNEVLDDQDKVIDIKKKEVKDDEQ